MTGITTDTDPGQRRGATSGATPAWASGPRLAWSFAALVVALVAMNVAQEAVFGYHDGRLLDLRLGYTHADVVALFGAYGSGGRQAYAIALVADTIYPIVLLATVVLATARAFGSRRWLWLPPLGFAVFDMVENALFGVMLATYPDIPSSLVAVAAPLTIVKLGCFVGTVAVGVAAALVLVRRRIPRTWRDDEGDPSHVSRRRLVAFWILLVLLLVVHLGDRPEQLAFVVTAFGDIGDLAGHEIHLFAQGVFAWVLVAAVLVHLRRPALHVGAAWTYGVGTVVALGMILALADLPPEVVPVLGAALVVAALAFVAHPSPWRARLQPTMAPSNRLFGLLAAAAVPLIMYAVGQIDIHLGSGHHDEHYTFGHWIVMAVVALLPLLLGVIAALKVAGWRFPLWSTGVLVATLGVASLGITAVSQLTTTWAALAIVWGGTFVAVGEWEARRDAPIETEPTPSPIAVG